MARPVAEARRRALALGRCRRWRLSLAGRQKLGERLVVVRAQVDVAVAPERAGEITILQQYRQEASLGVDRIAEERGAALQMNPIRAESGG